MTLFEVAKELADRLVVDLPARRRRPPARSSAGPRRFQDDPHWRDLILFYEYFHGDNGAGLGASHQTGWTGAVAKLIQLFGVHRRGDGPPRRDASGHHAVPPHARAGRRADLVTGAGDGRAASGRRGRARDER